MEHMCVYDWADCRHTINKDRKVCIFLGGFCGFQRGQPITKRSTICQWSSHDKNSAGVWNMAGLFSIIYGIILPN